MKVELRAPESVREPRFWLRQEQGLAIVLRPGSIEWGSQPSAMKRVDYVAGDLGMCPRREGKWVGLMSALHLRMTISDAALMATSEEGGGPVELQPYRKFKDPGLSALATAVNEEMIAGFPSGRLFLDSIEQAIAVALVNRHAITQQPMQTSRGGLGSARLRRIKEMVDAKLEEDLSLDEMAQSVELSTAHFAKMFRKSTGESPHRFLLRMRVERAKEMLRTVEMRILDVAVACGFKTQQHFARVFRGVCGTSPTEYRREFL
jgi:AraC family transcriptional regulator